MTKEELHIKLQEFILKWNGKYCEVAGSADAQNQCVDLANAYLRDVLNQPIVEWTNAIDFPSKLTEKFDYILNTPTGVPQEGDLIISGVNYGHIGIFLEGDANKFKSFDQNYPTGSFCTPVEHNYDSPKVHGWLRLKIGLDLQIELDKCRERRDELWNIGVKHCEILGVGADEQFTALTAEIEKLRGIEDQITDRDIKIEKAKIKIEELEIKMKTTTDVNLSLGEENKKLSDKVDTQGEEIKIQKIKIDTLSNDVDDLKVSLQVKALDGWKKTLAKLLFGL